MKQGVSWDRAGPSGAFIYSYAVYSSEQSRSAYTAGAMEELGEGGYCWGEYSSIV